MDNFYLGRIYSLEENRLLSQPVHYDPADLTTHAVVTGMTGSGKTGLCIALMEEAALQGIPSLVIDPKGDLTNLLLHFPALAPADFQPWLDAELIRRSGKGLEQAAVETADAWKSGLAEWDITPERVQTLADAIQFAVYTPGSDAGKPVSVLASLEVPPIPWEGNREILREKISATVTALLGLVGYEDIDPVRTREHILLSNIFENAWSQSRSLDLTELILQTQNPPFEKLGAFPVEDFFPQKDRTGLAMLLNNILASPTFEAWREGQPLDIPALLYTPEGKPRHNIFYIAHLPDAERMFFITLLLSSVETWMRTQAGSSSLRALVYFDEIYGYLPPQRNPPSKQPLLRMLKQARAFGVGLLLATQNPVDMDYKALANAGTWFVGKLQTERDKERLLDGLQSVNSSLDRAAFDRIIPALGKRVFLLHNVHQAAPLIFQTRWAMNFLAGPLTRAQVPALNELAGFGQPASPTLQGAPDSIGLTSFGVPQDSSTPTPAPVLTVDPSPFVSPSARPSSALPGSLTRPGLPLGVDEYFLPLSFSLTEAFQAAAEPVPADAQMLGVLYRPLLLAAAQARIIDRKYAVDKTLNFSALVDELDGRGRLRWEDYAITALDLAGFDRVPAPQARFEGLPGLMNDGKLLANLKRDYTDWVYRSARVTLRANLALKVWVGPDATQSEFRTACANAARAGRDAELRKALAGIDRQIMTIENKLEKAGINLNAEKQDLSDRSTEEWQAATDSMLGVFSHGNIKRFTRASEKKRLRKQAESDVETAETSIEHLQEQLGVLRAERTATEKEINARWVELSDDLNEITLTARKTDIFLDHFGAAWMPFYLVASAGQVSEMPAFSSGKV